jgi:hypothetical protein
MATSEYNALEHEGLEVVQIPLDANGASLTNTDEKSDAPKCKQEVEAPQVVPRNSELPIALCHDKEAAGLQVVHRTDAESPQVVVDTGPSLVRTPSLDLPILAFDDIAPEFRGGSMSNSDVDEKKDISLVDATAKAAKWRRRRCGLSKRWFIAVLVLITLVLCMAFGIAAVFGIYPALNRSHWLVDSLRLWACISDTVTGLRPPLKATTVTRSHILAQDWR